jgi:transketolase
MQEQLSEGKLRELADKAKAIRRHIVSMIHAAKSGHPGGSLSAAEILASLYFGIMRIDPQKPRWEERDRFVLCKGHAAPVLYATLAERGFFPVEELSSLRRIDSRLQGHPDMKSIPGVDMSTGSLGQGLSTANGMALAAKLDGKEWRVYALMGDGEQQEGQVWEAAMAAAHYKLDNITAFIDNNGLQIDGCIDRVMSPLPLADKWQAFGWQVISIDGHDCTAIARAVAQAQVTKGKPTVIIARTIKGKGVCTMENVADWHGKAPNQTELEQALKDLA